MREWLNAAAIFAALGIVIGSANGEPTKCTLQNAGAKAFATKFRKVETTAYVIEVPDGWEMGLETPFGQREILPGKKARTVAGASMTSMTGPGLGKQSWEQLYQTSLYFITAYAPGRAKMNATPFKLSKSSQGFDACSWTMLNEAGLPVQRHVILKNGNGNILALSVKIPSAAAGDPKERLEAIFQRMVDSAIVR